MSEAKAPITRAAVPATVPRAKLAQLGWVTLGLLGSLAARFLIDPYLGDLLPFVFFFPVVAFSAYLGGRGPAFLALGGSLLLANYFFISPRNQLAFANSSAWVASLAYLASNLVVIYVTEMMRKERRRAEAFAQQAEVERLRLTQEIVERQKNESALSASEEKFRAVAETAGNAIYIHDGTRLVFVNPAAEGITGYTREELMAGDMWAIVHPDYREQVMANARARFQGQPCPQRYEYMIVAKDGSARWLDFSANLVDFEGKKCILATAFDVTDRKLAEVTLRKTEKLAATGRLAASIAHEINNPLEAVTNLLYLMRTDPANQESYLHLAEQELKRVAHLTKQTLGFYRESSQRVATRPAELLDEVLMVYGAKLSHRKIVSELRLDRECEIEGYPGELRQVFSNLIANAADAMGEGGRLQVRLRPIQDPATGARGVRVTVADNGSGMDEKVLRHIYEPFFTTKEEVGTGLGLWVTKGIVEKHHGRLRVRSSTHPERRGTVFTLFLPAMKERQAGGAAA